MAQTPSLYSDRDFIPVIGQGYEAFHESLPEYLNCCKCGILPRSARLRNDKPDGWVKHHQSGCEDDGTNCASRCTIWVHGPCGLPSFSFSRECQVCGDLYMPARYPDYDWLCGSCGGESFDPSDKAHFRWEF